MALDHQTDETAERFYEWVKRYRVTIAVLMGLALIAVGMAVWAQFQRDTHQKQAAQMYAGLPTRGPERVDRLRLLLQDYGDTRVAFRARLDLADAIYAQDKFMEARTLYMMLVTDPRVDDAYRARARLGLGYSDTQLGHYEDARNAFEQVKRDGLYAVEAEEMLKLLADPPTLPEGFRPVSAVTTGGPTVTPAGTQGTE